MNRRTVLKGLLVAPFTLMGCPAREEPKPVPEIIPSTPDVKWQNEDEVYHTYQFETDGGPVSLKVKTYSLGYRTTSQVIEGEADLLVGEINEAIQRLNRYTLGGK